MRERLLIVDDERDMLQGLSRLLTRECGELEIITTTSARHALELVRKESFDLALLDVRMPEMDGLELLSRLREQDRWLTVVMMTAFGSIELAVEAVKGGAYDFITKPFDREGLLRVIRKSRERNRLIRENLNLRQQVGQKGALGSFVGQSAPMRRFYETLETVARTEYAVLVRGESGTGKELAARAIHDLSRRRERPLVTVNCPAIPEHLLESELFGHKRGAFTGADRDQTGLFEEADGGTICLDEIGDIPVSIQTKLLRVLQEQELKPLGATRSRKVDVRVLAVTNSNLEEKIHQRAFREDLFYRLNVVTLKTPALREIREDIPLLAAHFTRQIGLETGLLDRRFTPEALAMLTARAWPGNVRELQNFLRKVILFAPGEEIRPVDLQLEGEAPLPCRPAGEGFMELPELGLYKDMKKRLLSNFTSQYLNRLLELTGGNVSRAAEISGLTRPALQKIMRRTEINSSSFREN